LPFLRSLFPALAFSLLFLVFHPVANIGVGFLAGCALSISLLHISALQPLLDTVPRPAFIAAVVAVVVVINFFLESIVLPLASSTAGGFSVACGLDVYLHSGWNEQAKAILTQQDANRFPVSDEMIPLLVIFLVLAVVGMVCQYLVQRYLDEREMERITMSSNHAYYTAPYMRLQDREYEEI